MMLSVLIADDEPHARRHIKELLSKDEEVGAVFDCKNGKEVLNFLKNQTPNIIFLDINMPGISGVEIADKLKGSESIIIFSTAYDQYAIKAFELEVFDYLLKPFEDNRFFDVLQRAKAIIEKGKKASFSHKFASLYKEYSNSLAPHLTEFIIKEKGFKYKIHTDEILYLKASSVYVLIYLKDKNILYRTSLNLLEQQLPSNFIRVHRSFILNYNFIKKVRYLNNNTYSLTIDNDDVIISSRKYKDLIIQKLNKLKG